MYRCLFCAVCACMLILGGCSLSIVKESDMFYLKNDVSILQEDVQQLKRDVRDLSRGYKIVPIKVTITNATANVEQEEI